MQHWSTIAIHLHFWKWPASHTSATAPQKHAIKLALMPLKTLLSRASNCHLLTRSPPPHFNRLDALLKLKELRPPKTAGIILFAHSGKQLMGLRN
jgi:hypothetical protein